MAGSDFPAVIGPLQQRLPLARTAENIPRLAILPDLRLVALEGFPSFDLPRVLARQAAAHIIAAIPLEPASGIIGINPALLPPGRKRRARADAEIIQRAVMPLG